MRIIQKVAELHQELVTYHRRTKPAIWHLNGRFFAWTKSV
jgi:hypothetical protein